MLGFRAAGAAGGASLAAVVGTGGAALVGIGLSLAAVYIYDKYVSPNATTKPSETPVAQVNIDNMSRPLTDIEKLKGFTNNTTAGQAVIPPSSSVAYPPLWSGPGSASQPSVSGHKCSDLGIPVGGWATTTNNIQLYANPPGLPIPSRGVGYAPVNSLGNYCMVNSVAHTIYMTTVRCALGYGGADCTLQAIGSIVLPEDGVCQILRSGNSFTVENRDPDCTPKPGQSNPLPTFIGTGTGKGKLSFVSKPDSDGRPSVATIDVENGQADVVVATPNITRPTYTNNMTSAAVPNATTGSAPVTTVTQTDTTGVGAGAAVSNPATTPATTGDINVEVDLPPNLAKTEDIAAVKTAIEGLKETPVAPFNPNSGTVIAPDSTDAVTGAIGDGSELPSVFSFSPTLPGSVNAPNISFQLAGSSVNMNISAWIGYVRNFLGVLLYTVTPFVVFSIVSGRRQED
jgi:hypothetical protein